MENLAEEYQIFYQKFKSMYFVSARDLIVLSKKFVDE
jgi:hypothetical protein